MEHIMYLVEKGILEVELITEEKLGDEFRRWCNKIADDLGIYFQGKWDLSGFKPYDLLQFTDNENQTATTFYVHYAPDMSYDELYNVVRDKLNIKRKEFGKELVRV